MSNANPYQAPKETGERTAVAQEVSAPVRLANRYQAAFWLIAYLYPLWLLGSFYLTWFVAAARLGRFPQPMLDDPKSIGGIVSLVYFIPGVLLVFLPMLAPVGLLASWFHRVNLPFGSRNFWRLVLAVLYVLLFAFVIFVLRSDPWRVVEWWFD